MTPIIVYNQYQVSQILSKDQGEINRQESFKVRETQQKH